MNAYDVEGNAINTAFTKTGSHQNDIYDMGGTRIGFNRDWLTDAISTLIADILVGGVKQGGCTDGEYIYQMALGSDANGDAHLIKLKISDGTYTVKHYKYTSTFWFSHANDMIYNPNTGYLYICRMESDGSVYVLDASDLSYVDTIYLKNASNEAYTVWQFCYNRWEDCYYSAHNGNYLVYDNAWQYVRSISMPTVPTSTAQGCETDGQYIYRVMFNPNYIDVTRVDGTHVKTLNLSAGGYEPEAIMYDWDGHYYVSTNPSDKTCFFEVEMFI